MSGVRRVSGVDWPLLLSCFACLWHEAAESEDDVVELAGSESLQDFGFPGGCGMVLLRTRPCFWQIEPASGEEGGWQD